MPVCQQQVLDVKHTKGDYDNDGLDEVFVRDYPNIRLIEYHNEQMQVTWSKTENNTVYLTTGDLRNDNYDNLVFVNRVENNADTVIFAELKITPPQNLSYINYNGNPKLTWQASNSPFVTGYDIYRNSVLIATVNANILEYIDYDIAIVPNSQFTYTYIVKAFGIAKQNVSNPSNQVRIQGLPMKPIKNFVKNYPNPFNPSTSISYQIKERGFVNLKIFNSLGQEIATLVNEVKESGSYEIDFDGKNLSSGIYFYQLIISNGSQEIFTETKRMMLVK